MLKGGRAAEAATDSVGKSQLQKQVQGGQSGGLPLAGEASGKGELGGGGDSGGGWSRNPAAFETATGATGRLQLQKQLQGGQSGGLSLVGEVSGALGLAGGRDCGHSWGWAAAIPAVRSDNPENNANSEAWRRAILPSSSQDGFLVHRLRAVESLQSCYCCSP